MDGHRFDEMTRAWAAGGVSRRRVLRGLLGGTLGGALAAVGLREVAAACPHPLVACPRIGGECVNLRADPENCGRCGRVCDSGVCFAGRCRDACPRGFEECAGVCCDRDEECKFGDCEPEFSDLGVPPAVVWQALTDQKTLAVWEMANTVEPRVGSRFQLRTAPRVGYDGVMEGEVLEFDAPRRLVFAWRGGPLVEPVPVTITLEPVADGTQTRLRLTQDSGTDAPCKAAALLLGRNWQRVTSSPVRCRATWLTGAGRARRVRQR